MPALASTFKLDSDKFESRPPMVRLSVLMTFVSRDIDKSTNLFSTFMIVAHIFCAIGPLVAIASAADQHLIDVDADLEAVADVAAGARA